MSSSAGWYPDPGGQPGLYRWWTGTAWTESVTANPQGTPPPGNTVPETQGGTSAGPGNPDPYRPGKTRRATGWWVGGGVALVAVVIAVVLLIQSMGGSIPGIPNIGGKPTSTSSPNICPPATESTAQPTSPPAGWISSGRLAYPALDSPWETGWDNRVPWGARAMVQSVTDQENFDGKGNSWVASVLVGDIYVGDGFASSKVAAETILTCVLGIYYADNPVTAKQISSSKRDVDGHSGWLIETQLSFDIPGLNAKGERILLLVVQTDEEKYALFYASVPDTLTELLPDARKAMSGLKVQ